MSMLMRAMLRGYMAPAGDAEGGGGEPEDRGDEVGSTEQTSTEETSTEETLTEEEQAAADLAAAATAEDQPRDANGKFTKKSNDENHIPKERFNEAVGKERAAREAAERKAADLEARLHQEQKSEDISKKETELEKLESDHTKALLDGKHEDAAKIMKQIRHGEREIARMENQESNARATSQAVEQVRWESAVARLEADYTVFNPESEDYDQDLIDMAAALQAQLIRTERMSPSQALLEAGKRVVAKMTKTAPVDEPKKGLAEAATQTGDRKATQVKKNVETAKAQPAALKNVGENSDKHGEKSEKPIDQMTMEEWNALPESTKARLRGDVI